MTGWFSVQKTMMKAAVRSGSDVVEVVSCICAGGLKKTTTKSVMQMT
jgi:hypothetical protein